MNDSDALWEETDHQPSYMLKFRQAACEHVYAADIRLVVAVALF